MARVLHGQGARAGESGNRWFDKSLSFVFTPDGFAGVNLEHSPFDGGPAVHLINHMIGRERMLPGLFAPGSPAAAPRLLQWVADAQTTATLAQAKAHADALAQRCAVRTYDFTEYDAGLVKKYGLSPDAFFQMAIQLAYYRLHGHCSATYESASTRMYEHGRTETIRSCSQASHALVSAMTDSPLAPPQERVRLLNEAVEAHKQYTRLATTGYGCDRHLLGLLLTAREHNLDASFFAQPAWAKSTHFRLR